MDKSEIVHKTVKIWSDRLRGVDDEIIQCFEDELFIALEWRLRDDAWDQGEEIPISLGIGYGNSNPVACALRRCDLGYQNLTFSLTTFLSKQGIRIRESESVCQNSIARIADAS
jgi:hypothetical protein